MSPLGWLPERSRLLNIFTVLISKSRAPCSSVVAVQGSAMFSDAEGGGVRLGDSEMVHPGLSGEKAGKSTLGVGIRG